MTIQDMMRETQGGVNVIWHGPSVRWIFLGVLIYNRVRLLYTK